MKFVQKQKFLIFNIQQNRYLCIERGSAFQFRNLQNLSPLNLGLLGD